jgi:hypothetical protein
VGYLANELHVKVRIKKKPHEWKAYHVPKGSSSFEIDVPPVRDRKTYFVWLHELGHVACGHVYTLGLREPGQLEREAEAWEWAVQHSIVKPDAADWQEIARCLTTYRVMLKHEIQDSPRARLLYDFACLCSGAA